jgi:hypothetical protein
LTVILDRAVAPGEIDGEKLIPSIAALLNDRFRHHSVMTFSPSSRALRTAWVDTIFLPLVRALERP